MKTKSTKRGEILATWLPNGFIRIDDRRSGLVALYNQDGTRHSGPAILTPALWREVTAWTQ